MRNVQCKDKEAGKRKTDSDQDNKPIQRTRKKGGRSCTSAVILRRIFSIRGSHDSSLTKKGMQTLHEKRTSQSQITTAVNMTIKN